MPFNGIGGFTLVAGNPVVTGTTISSTVQNNTMTDFANGFVNCVTRDGQSPALANIPMGNFKITGLAAGTTNGDAIRWEQWNLKVNTSDLAASNGSSLVGFLQSGTGAVARTTESKLRDFVSVKDFGAVGDDTNDDTSAINAALATGLSVYFPYGTYKITADLVFSAQNATSAAGRKIFGCGFGAGFGGFAGGSTIHIVGAGVNGFKCTDTLPFVSIDNLSVIGDNTTGEGFWFTGTLACSNFTNISTYTGKRGVYAPQTAGSFGSSFALTFTNCHFSSYTEHGVELAGGPGTTFVGCYVHNIPTLKAGWRIYSQANFFGCNAVDAGTTAAIVGRSPLSSDVAASDGTTTSAYCSFVGCNFETFTTAGVEVRGGGQVTFRDCLFAGTGAYQASIIQNFGSSLADLICIERCTFFNTTTNFQPFSGAIWQATSYYPVGAIVQNDSPRRLYVCTTAGTSAGAGGPTGTGTGIADGTCVWNFLAVAATSRVRRSELFVKNGGQSNYIVKETPSLGAKPQVDFGGVSISNAAGNGTLVNIDGTNFAIGDNSGVTQGPLVIAGPASAATGIAANTRVLGNVSSTTVGAAGGAAALPATPLGYHVEYRNGSMIKTPYYSP